MKLIDSVALMLGFGFIVIGAHQSLLNGLANSYWLFMLSTVLFIFYGYRKKQYLLHQEEEEKARQNKKKTKRKKRR